MTTAPKKKNPCKFCEKKGFAILPARIGIAPTKAVYRPFSSKLKKTAPDAVELLGESVAPATLDAPATVYTGRALRGGYLYVYYQDHDEWEGYSVDKQACLSGMPLPDETPRTKHDSFQNHNACARNAVKVANASLLVIPDPGSAGVVWIGFSDTLWTKAVRDANADLIKGAAEKADAERGQSVPHMVRIDVTGIHAKKTSCPKHTWPIKIANLLVADYALHDADLAFAFYESPYKFVRGDAGALSKEAEKLNDWDTSGYGFVAVLPDPVGVATELANYMHWRWRALTHDYARPLQVDADLNQLELAIKRQAEENLFHAAHQLHMNTVTFQGGGKPMPNSAMLLPSYRKKMQPILDEVVTEKELKNARMEAWAGKDGKSAYVAAIDHAKRQAFRNTFAEAANGTAGKDGKPGTKGFNDTHMAPLARAHAGCMSGPAMAAVFDHHFDPKDIHSGVAFSAVFAACIAGTSAYGACLKQYQTWLKAGVTKHNLLWRALTFNQASLAAKVAAVTGSYAHPDESQWHDLLKTSHQLAKQLKGAGSNACEALVTQAHISILLGELGPSMTTALKAQDTVGKNVLAVLGMYAGHSIHQVTVHGTVMETYQTLYEGLTNLKPDAVKGSQSQRTTALDHRLRVYRAKLEDAGKDPDTPTQWTALVYGAVVASPDIASQSSFLIKKLGSEMTVDAFGERLVRTLQSETVLAPVAAVIGLLGMRDAAEVDEKALASEQGRADATLGAARAGFASGMFQVVEKFSKAYVSRRSSVLSVAAVEDWGSIIKASRFGGALAGAVAGWVLAGVDAVNVLDALGEDEDGMAALYFLRGLGELAIAADASVTVIWFLVTGTFAELFGGPVVWVVTAVIVILTVIISAIEDPATLTWVEQCDFGVNPFYGADKSGAEREQEDFANALAAG